MEWRDLTIQVLSYTMRMCVYAKSLQSCLIPCNPTRLLCPWDFPGNNTGVGCHALLQGICSTWRLNPHLFRLHWQVGSLPLATWEAYTMHLCPVFLPSSMYNFVSWSCLDLPHCWLTPQLRWHLLWAARWEWALCSCLCLTPALCVESVLFTVVPALSRVAGL